MQTVRVVIRDQLLVVRVPAFQEPRTDLDVALPEGDLVAVGSHAHAIGLGTLRDGAGRQPLELRQRACRHKKVLLPRNALRVRQITHGHAVGVRGHHANRPVNPRHQDTGQQRPAVVVRRRTYDLTHRLTQRRLRELRGGLVGLADGRGLHDWIRVQIEGRPSRTDGDVISLISEGHCPGLEAADNFRRQPRRNYTTPAVAPERLAGHEDREIKVGPGHGQRIPVTGQQQAQQHRGRAAAASYGTARRGQHVDECIALGSELHRRLSFREFSQSFIVEGEVYEVGRGNKGCGLWMRWLRACWERGSVSPWRCGPCAGLMLRAGHAGWTWGRVRRWSPGSVGFVHSLCRRRTTTGWTAAGRMEWSGRAGTDLLDQLGDLLVDLASFLHLAGD